MPPNAPVPLVLVRICPTLNPAISTNDKLVIKVLVVVLVNPILVPATEPVSPPNNKNVPAGWITPVMPVAVVGIITSLVPFANYGPGTRTNMGSKNQKQAIILNKLKP